MLPMRSSVVALLVLAVAACEPPRDARATELGTASHARCVGCHGRDFQRVETPAHEGALPTTCFVCHSEDEWSPALLTHPFFVLDGAHLGARCFDCHRDQSRGTETYEGTSRTCVTCHGDDFERAAGLHAWHRTAGPECVGCHATTAWLPSTRPWPPPAPVAVDAGVGSVLDGLDGIGRASMHDRSGPVEPPRSPIALPPPPPHHPHRRHHAPESPPPETPPETPPPETPPSLPPEIPPDGISGASGR